MASDCCENVSLRSLGLVIRELNLAISLGAAQWNRGSSASDISSATQRLLANAGDFSELEAPSPSREDPSLDGAISHLRTWLAALVKGRRSSFSIFANALTPDTKLAAIQAQALTAVQAAKDDAVKRAAVACLRRIDTDGLHTCSAKHSESHSLECRFRRVMCKHKGCGSVHSAIHDEEHSSVCEWTPLICVLCAVPVAACVMHEHTINACQERPVVCAFSCCDVTFPLSSRGMHNKDAVAAHADYLLQQYIRRQRILQEINERAAALVSSNNQNFAHVAAVNAGLVSDAAKMNATYGPAEVEKLVNWWQEFSRRVKERLDEADRVLAQTKTVKGVCDGTAAHLKEMQRLKQMGGKVQNP